MVFALALLVIWAVTGLWALLMYGAYSWLIPRVERWMWRKLGGEGEPPPRS